MSNGLGTRAGTRRDGVDDRVASASSRNGCVRPRRDDDWLGERTVSQFPDPSPPTTGRGVGKLRRTVEKVEGRGRGRMGHGWERRGVGTDSESEKLGEW